MQKHKTPIFCFKKFSSGSCHMTSKLSLLSPNEPARVQPSCVHWLWRPINIFRQLVQDSLQSQGWPNLPMTSTSTRYPTASFVTTTQSSVTRPQNAVLCVSSNQQQEMELFPRTRETREPAGDTCTKLPLSRPNTSSKSTQFFQPYCCDIYYYSTASHTGLPLQN